MDRTGQGPHGRLMSTERQSRPAATNCETAKDASAGSLKSVPMISQPPKARPTFGQRVQWRRRVARELDWLLGTCRYPDPATLYGVQPSRERAGERA
jgi:hypothetical protein